MSTPESMSENAGPPPTSIVRHRRERRRKCSLTPLEDHPAFRFYGYPGDTPDFTDHVRLALTGPPLGVADRDRPILVLDATWRLAEPMERRYAEVEPRSLPPLVTAYPRVSKVREDPEGGLASIEALIAAYHILGRDLAHLIQSYPLASPFLAKNEGFFADNRR